MRKSIVIMAVALSVSCAAGVRITDAFTSLDRTIPEIVSWKLEDSGSFTVSYSEEVTLEEVLLEGREIRMADSAESFFIAFPENLARGEEYTLFITAEDIHGNTLRTAFFLTGPNDDVPRALINEISPEAPDRVEILILEDGSTAGMVLKDGTDDAHSGRFVFPDISVKANDIILIYWNGDEEESAWMRDDGGMTHVLNAGLNEGLTATNAPLILYREEGGEIIDGVIYTTGEAETAGGYGNTRTAEAMVLLSDIGEWEGLPVSSADITASRVLARRPGGYDTNTRHDWFTTAARSSTFGELNAYLPYQEKRKPG